MSRILLVDDEPDLLILLAKMLVAAGHEAVTVDNGDAAIKRLVTSSFDLMMMDIRMRPMDGIELLTATRKLKPDMPVIMLTAYTDVDTIEKAKSLGAFAFLRKPFQLSELIDTVNRALMGANAGDKPNV